MELEAFPFVCTVISVPGTEILVLTVHLGREDYVPLGRLFLVCFEAIQSASKVLDRNEG